MPHLNPQYNTNKNATPKYSTNHSIKCYLRRLICFFISNTFISNVRLKLATNQANAKQHPEVELFAI